MARLTHIGCCGIKALIVAPPTLDYIIRGGSVYIRPGGPALYAGFALIDEWGFDVYSIGPTGFLTIETVRVEEKIGVSRFGYMESGLGALFLLAYNNGNRTVHVMNRVGALDISVISSALRLVNPEMVLIAPVVGEEPGLLHNLGHIYSRCVSIDIQGYARFDKSLVAHVASGRYTVLHASSDDLELADIREAASSTVIYTRGLGPITVIDKSGDTLNIKVEMDEPVDDPTGAGDVFTALVLVEMCNGMHVIDAVKEAIRRVPRILKRASYTLDIKYLELLDVDLGVPRVAQ